MRPRTLTLCALAGALLVLRPHAARAQGHAADSAPTLPFTAEQDRDGARFVWFAHGRAGLGYTYVPADSFPASAEFTEVEPYMVQAGDVAWWPQWMGIADGKGGVQGAGGVRALTDLTRRYGEPRYFRRLRPTTKP